MSGKSNIDYGANYDQIMNDIQGLDFSNGIPSDFLNTHNFLSRFASMIINAENPLNQLVLDKALGLKTNATNTQSCQTTSIINAWAVNTENGISGQNILNVLQRNEDGTFGEEGFVGSDGRLLSIWGLGFNMGKELKLDSYITAGDTKIIPPNILENLSVGAIVGVSKNMKRDEHFLFANWSYTIDAMDHTRPAASEYTIRSHRVLYWQSY